MHNHVASPQKTSSTVSVQLVVVQGHPLGKRVPVSSPQYTIGRDPGCQLRPRSESVSGRHAELTIEGNHLLIRDLQSQTGTLVNGQPISKTVALKDGDRIRIGPLTFRVLIEPVKVKKKSAGSSSLDDAVAFWVSEDSDED